MNAAKAASRMRSRTAVSSPPFWWRFDNDVAIILSLTTLVPYRTITSAWYPLVPAHDHRRADDPFAKTGGYSRASHENHARRNSCDRSPVSRRQDSAVVHARRRPGRHLHTELQGRGGGSGPHRKPTSCEGKPHGRAVHSGRATLAARDTVAR